MITVIKLKVSLRVFDGLVPLACAKQKGHTLPPGDYEVERVPNPYHKDWPDWYALRDKYKEGIPIGGPVGWWELFGTNALEILIKKSK